MIVVTGLIEIAPESRDAAIGAAIRLAEATRKEAGCISYAFYADIENANRFRVYEEWQSKEALAEHFQQPHMAEFAKAMQGVTRLSQEVVEFEPGPITRH